MNNQSDRRMTLKALQIWTRRKLPKCFPVPLAVGATNGRLPPTGVALYLDRTRVFFFIISINTFVSSFVSTVIFLAIKEEIVMTKCNKPKKTKPFNHVFIFFMKTLIAMRCFSNLLIF